MKVNCGLDSMSFMEDNSGDEDDGDFSLDSSSQGQSGMKSERKSNKPIMEKRRRARINSCLNELKGILLEAMRKDPARHSKLEKADILELTVRHLQNIQRNQLAIAMATDPTVLHRFKNGFSECATEVSRYLGRLDSVDHGMKQRVTGHLGACVNGLQQVGPAAFGSPRYSPLGGGIQFSVPPSPLPPPAGHPHVLQPPLAPAAATPATGLASPQLAGLHQVSSGGDLNNNRYSGGNTTPSSTVTSSSTFDPLRTRHGPSAFTNNTTPRRPPPTPPPSPPLNPEQQHPNEKGTNTTPIFNIGGCPPSTPLDFSVGKHGSLHGDKMKRELRDVRVGKVEPMVKAEADSSGGHKDSMWRPW